MAILDMFYKPQNMGQNINQTVYFTCCFSVGSNHFQV